MTGQQSPSLKLRGGQGHFRILARFPVGWLAFVVLGALILGVEHSPVRAQTDTVVSVELVEQSPYQEESFSFDLKFEPPLDHITFVRINYVRHGSTADSETFDNWRINGSTSAPKPTDRIPEVNFNAANAVTISIEKVVRPSNLPPYRYTINPNENTFTVNKISSTMPGVSISSDSNSISGGESAKLDVDLTGPSTWTGPGQSVTHEIYLTWSPPGLVTSVGGETPSSTSSHTASAIFAATDKSLSDSNKVTIITDNSVIGETDGTITATLSTEDPLPSDSNYNPVFSSELISTDIVVKKQSLSLTQQTGFKETILVTELGTTTYADNVVNFASSTGGNTMVEYEVEVQRGDNAKTTSGVQSNSFDHDGWVVDVAAGTATLTPSNISVFDSLGEGESLTSSFIARLKSGDRVIEELSATTTLRRPKLTLNFEDGTTAQTIASTNAGAYDDLTGTTLIENTEGTGAGPVFNTSEMASGANVSGRLDPGDGTPTSPSIDIGEDPAYPVGENFTYGTWYFTLDGSKHLFRPNAGALDNLAVDAIVTSTATVDVDGTNISKTLTVTLTGNGPPPIPTITLLGPDTITEGGVIQFRISRNLHFDRRATVGVEISQTADLIQWRVPTSVALAPGESTVNIDIPTVDNNADDGSSSRSVTLTLISDNSGDYQLSRDMSRRSVTVPVMDNDSSGSASTVYSVASMALTQILQSNQSSAEERSPSSHFSSPVLTITALKPIVNEGDAVVFMVTASEAPSADLLIALEVNLDGDFTSSSPPDTVVLAANQTTVNVELPTTDDDQAEPDGTITINLAAGSGYRIAEAFGESARVNVSDAFDRMRREEELAEFSASILPDVTWSMGMDAFDNVASRFDRSVGQPEESSLILFGQGQMRNMLVSGGEMVNGNGLDWERLIADSSFTVNLASEGMSSGTATIWGVGNSRELTGTGLEASSPWEGSHASGYIGFDSRLGESSLVGLTMSFHSTRIELGSESGPRHQFEASSTGIQPYLGMTFPSDLNFWVTTGYGPGTVRLAETDYETEKSRTTFQMVGSGVEKHISIWDDGGALNRHGLSLNGLVWHAQHNIEGNSSYLQSLQTDAGRVQLAAEVNRQWIVDGNSTLVPSAVVGLRSDNYRSETTAGMMLGTGVVHENTMGLTLKGSGQLLLSGVDRVLDRQVEGLLEYDRNRDELGIVLEMKQTWADEGGSLPTDNWSDEWIFFKENRDAVSSQMRLQSKLGYGIHFNDNGGILTPYSGVELIGSNNAEYSLGGSYRQGTILDLQLEGVYGVNRRGGSQQFQLSGKVQW